MYTTSCWSGSSVSSVDASASLSQLNSSIEIFSRLLVSSVGLTCSSPCVCFSVFSTGFFVTFVENSSSPFISISCSQGILNSSRLSCFLLLKIVCLHVSFTAYENFYNFLIFHFPFFRISECRNPTIKHISNYTCP